MAYSPLGCVKSMFGCTGYIPRPDQESGVKCRRQRQPARHPCPVARVKGALGVQVPGSCGPWLRWLELGQQDSDGCFEDPNSDIHVCVCVLFTFCNERDKQRNILCHLKAMVTKQTRSHAISRDPGAVWVMFYCCIILHPSLCK